jgi:hypothetical protein
MLGPVRLGSLIRRWWIVAAAALVICALQALPGAAAGADGGGGGGAGTGDEQAEPPPFVSFPPHDGGVASRAERRRIRRQRHLGQQPDGGTPVDAGASRDAAPFHIAARDGGGFRMPAFPRPVIPPPAPAPPPPPPPAPSTPSTSQPISELGFNTCRKIPAGKRAVKVTLKPDVELPELVAWISSITCKSFVLPGHLSAGGKKITLVTQGTMTPREAYSTFLTALDSIGLTVEQGPGYLKIIETAKAKTASLPVYGFDGQPTEQKPRRAKPAQSGN